MGHGVKLLEVQLVIGADVDIRAPVFRHVAILGSGENWSNKLAASTDRRTGRAKNYYL